MITLVWMDKIRERLKEYESKHIVFRVATRFIQPIIEYGEAEEKRISEAFAKELRPDYEEQIEHDEQKRCETGHCCDRHPTGRKCDGKLYYDEGCEGHLCPKCDYYDGVK
jgi:hypothetical protein